MCLSLRGLSSIVLLLAMHRGDISNLRWFHAPSRSCSTDSVRVRFSLKALVTLFEHEWILLCCRSSWHDDTGEDLSFFCLTIGKILSCITVSADQKAAIVHFISSLSFVQMSLNAAHFLFVLKCIFSSHKGCDSLMRNRPKLHCWMQIDLAMFCLCRVQSNRCEYLQCLRERIRFTYDCLCPLLHT